MRIARGKRPYVSRPDHNAFAFGCIVPLLGQARNPAGAVAHAVLYAVSCPAAFPSLDRAFILWEPGGAIGRSREGDRRGAAVKEVAEKE